MEGVFRFKSWFQNAPGLIHGGAYYRNFTVFEKHVTGCVTNAKGANKRSSGAMSGTTGKRLVSWGTDFS